jgi:phospholipase D1/2
MDSYMAPVPNAPEDTTQSLADALVADPLSDQLQTLWSETAQRNTSILLNIFKTVPNNLVRNWKEYDVRAFSDV